MAILTHFSTHMVNASWWAAALAAPAVDPSWEAISSHVCGRRAACVAPCEWVSATDGRKRHPSLSLLVRENPYFSSECRRGRAATPGWPRGVFPRWDGLGHVGLEVARRAAAGAAASDGAAVFFAEDVTLNSVYLRDVAGLAEAYAPSLYCHETERWFRLEEGAPRGQTVKAFNDAPDAFVADFAKRYATGAALFRDFFECYVVPDLDQWFALGAIAAEASSGATAEAAVADAYEAAGRGAVVGACGAPGGGALRVAIHLRLGDLLSEERRTARTATSVAPARIEALF